MLRQRTLDLLVKLADRHRVLRTLERMPGLRGQSISSGPAAGLRFDPGPSNAAYAFGTNELPVQRALLEHLRPGHTVYDIGANVGYFSVISARAVGPSGLVYAFEPVPANALWIRRNARLNMLRNVRVAEKAVSDATGRADFLVTHYSGGGVLASADHRAPDVERAVTVDTVTVDDQVYQMGLRKPDLVKIDVEGGEIMALRGMSRTLLEARPVVIYEIDDISQDAYDRKQHQCDDALRKAGYSISRLASSYPDSRWIVGHTVAIPC